MLLGYGPIIFIPTSKYIITNRRSVNTCVLLTRTIYKKSEVEMLFETWPQTTNLYHTTINVSWQHGYTQNILGTYVENIIIKPSKWGSNNIFITLMTTTNIKWCDYYLRSLELHSCILCCPKLWWWKIFKPEMTLASEPFFSGEQERQSLLCWLKPDAFLLPHSLGSFSSFRAPRPRQLHRGSDNRWLCSTCANITPPLTSSSLQPLHFPPLIILPLLPRSYRVSTRLFHHSPIWMGGYAGG